MRLNLIIESTDDCFKDKKDRTEKGQDGITSAMLTEAIKKSMHVFWDFLRVDKDEKGRVDLQNPADLDLLMDVQAELQKVWFLTCLERPDFP